VSAILTHRQPSSSHPINVPPSPVFLAIRAKLGQGRLDRLDLTMEPTGQFDRRLKMYAMARI
jgi:hypothetical protein